MPAPPELLRLPDGRLLLRCGARLDHLRLRLLLRLKHGFRRQLRAGAQGSVVLRDFTRGPLTLYAAVDELARVTLMAECEAGKRVLLQLAGELRLQR